MRREATLQLWGPPVDDKLRGEVPPPAGSLDCAVHVAGVPLLPRSLTAEVVFEPLTARMYVASGPLSGIATQRFCNRPHGTADRLRIAEVA